MPPANSPSDTPRRPDNTVALDQLAELASPVPDFASTLMSQAEEDANEANVSFLRSSSINSDGEDDYLALDSLRQARRLRQMDNLISEQRRIQSERESARRLRRAVLRSGMSPSVAQQQDSEGGMTYHAISPPRDSRRSSSYQGWAPGTMDNETEENNLTFSELRALARGHTRPSLDAATRRHYREEDTGLPGTNYGSRTAADSEEMDWQTSRTVNGGFNPSTADPSLRTTALLQSVRRHARFSSPRSWQLTQPSDSHPNHPQSTHERDWSANAEMSRMLRARDRLESLARDGQNDLHRVRAREESSPDPSFLEEAIKYLEALRSCESDSERLSLAKEGSFLGIDDDLRTPDPGDFIIDPSRITPPQASSWLRAGAVFSGSQRSESSATFPSIQLFHPPSAPLRRSHDRYVATNSNSSRYTAGWQRSGTAQPAAASGTSSRPWLQSSAQTSSSSSDDTWPVKVTVTSIDQERMTLTGTMEAFNVPNKNAPHAESTIATFLEGEIIDFNRFTLETKSFNATVRTDSTYWRELEPFKGLDDAKLAKSVVSRKWLSEELGKKYILMRWKEKCFITPSDAQVHLTISGFYYISLRRDNGHVEGLYFDPTSSPYQHLQLQPANRDFPSFSFK